MDTPIEKPESLRERKRRQTRERIAETGLRLFIEHGYDATTLDAITAAAGISRRTFFYYFKSKEDVVLAWQGGDFTQALKPAILEESPHQTPLNAVRNCLLKLATRFETKEAVTVDQLMRSTEVLLARKEAIFVETEQTLLESMRELWPTAEQGALRIVAMLAMGVLRIASEDWRQHNADRPLAHYIQHYFELLERQF